MLPKCPLGSSLWYGLEADSSINSLTNGPRWVHTGSHGLRHLATSKEQPSSSPSCLRIRTRISSGLVGCSIVALAQADDGRGLKPLHEPREIISAYLLFFAFPHRWQSLQPAILLQAENSPFDSSSAHAHPPGYQGRWRIGQALFLHQ